MDAGQFVTAGKDFVLAIAAGVTAFVGYKGIQKWRQELEGKATFDAARALARAVYRFRDALRNARAPLITAGEFPPEHHMGRRSGKDLADDYRHVYRTRLDHVFGTLQELDAAALEAEALWGADVKRLVEDLKSSLWTVRAAVEAVVADKAEDGAHFRDDRAFGVRVRNEVSRFGDDSDELSKLTASRVAAIEAALGPRLRR
jgi:hypothetical protein